MDKKTAIRVAAISSVAIILIKCAWVYRILDVVRMGFL